MNQIELHQRIDEILNGEINDITKEDILTLVMSNDDAYKYFYFKADSRWLHWLFKNRFFDVLKRNKDVLQSDVSPELNYLAKLSAEEPEIVTQIMLSIPISKKNLDLIDAFSQICSKLPADQLAKMVEKMDKESWVVLSRAFNQWGFQYQDMLETLLEAKDYKHFLLLAKILLSVRSKEEMDKTSEPWLKRNPFYFNDLGATEIFEKMITVADDYLEKTLNLVSGTMKAIVLLNAKNEKGSVFKLKDNYELSDVDFFEVDLKGRSISYHGLIRELAVTLKTLLDRLIQQNLSNPQEIKRIYKTYVDSLPQNTAMWRLKLYALSLVPKIPKIEFKEAIFRLFKVKDYRDHYELDSGTEYKKLLRKSFHVLTDEEKKQYVEEIFKYFGKDSEDKEGQKWMREDGSNILSMIFTNLSEELKQKIEQSEFKIDVNYEPRPSMGTPTVGFVQPQSPLNLEDFSVKEVAEKLRNELSPREFKKNGTDDFMKPRNAEGVGNNLKEDISNRLNEYIDNADLFFERGVLDLHYTYSFLSGIDQVLRQDKLNDIQADWQKLIQLFIKIKDSGESASVEAELSNRSSVDRWLADWQTVLSALADVIDRILSGGYIKNDFPKYRDNLLEVIAYLLTYPDPTSEEEMPKSTPSEKGMNYLSDPFTSAINSVRGKAFKNLVLFIFQDEKQFQSEEKVKLSEDVKTIYKMLLAKENTRAIMFLFGHYLVHFYYRDKKWTQKLLSQIFPQNSAKKHLYSAAWEGMISNNLFSELFFDPAIQELYKKGLTLEPDPTLKQKRFREPEEALATHLALAFMHYDEFDFNHPLFKAFWIESKPDIQIQFIRFLGRSFVSGNNEGAVQLLQNKPDRKKRLSALWEKTLNDKNDPKLFSEFGFWINVEKGLFDEKWLAQKALETLQKTNGILDWPIKLMDSIKTFAQKSPQESLGILHLYFLEGVVRKKENKISFQISPEWIEGFKILYLNKKVQQKVYHLIDTLILEGGRRFWPLKEVLNA